MKKQILYAPFVPRLFSTMMDLCLCSILLILPTMMLNKYVLIKKFGAIFKAKNTDISNMQSLQEALQSPEFAPYSNLDTIIELMIPMLCMQMICYILYFILCWKMWGTTPVKYIMRMRVVDSENFTKPTIFQAVRRIIGYVFFSVGIWYMFFSKNKQMLHDKIAGTVVIRT